jgi:hypothetical protein
MPDKKTGIAKKVAKKKVAPGACRMAMADGHFAVETWMEQVQPELQPLTRRLDQLILEAMPEAICAVKWGVPFYGLAGQGWIAAINSFKAHVKLLFFGGSALKPALPAGKEKNAIDFHSAKELLVHEKQVKTWLQQAKKLPGWNLKNFPRKAA